MSANYYHNICTRHRGRAVEIRTHDGRIHRGIIDRVDRGCVFLRPLGGSCRLGGFSYGFGFGLIGGIALGSIATLALLPLFYWW